MGFHTHTHTNTHVCMLSICFSLHAYGMAVILTLVSKPGKTFSEHSQFSIASYQDPLLIIEMLLSEVACGSDIGIDTGK